MGNRWTMKKLIWRFRQTKPPSKRGGRDHHHRTRGGGTLGGVEEGGAAHLTPLNSVDGRRHTAEEHLQALQQHLTPLNKRGVKKRYPRPPGWMLPQKWIKNRSKRGGPALVVSG